MNEKLLKLIIPAAISLAISAAAGVTNFVVTTVQMDARIATLEKDATKHELAKEKEFSRLTVRTDDHEQRLIRLETNLGAIQETLNEMRADVKELLRGIGK